MKWFLSQEVLYGVFTQGYLVGLYTETWAEDRATPEMRAFPGYHNCTARFITNIVLKEEVMRRLGDVKEFIDLASSQNRSHIGPWVTFFALDQRNFATGEAFGSMGFTRVPSQNATTQIFALFC